MSGGLGLLLYDLLFVPFFLDMANLSLFLPLFSVMLFLFSWYSHVLQGFLESDHEAHGVFI
jgi:hypothetical protein